MKQMMIAAIRRTYGSTKNISLEEIEKPMVKPNQVLIKIHATTVNRTDCAILTAKPFIMRFLLGMFKPKKIILGTDFAGEIIEVGADVKNVKNGDKVFGFDDNGTETQAGFAKIEASKVFKIPVGINYTTAAASLEGAHYAYTFVHKVSIEPGARILINGATGGIGSALLQFLKSYDVHITATCNTKNMDLIRSLGADKLYDYTKEDFTKDSTRFDFIFDAVGKNTYKRCKPLLTKKGIYISSELGPNAQNLFYALGTSFSKGKKVLFPIPYSSKETIPYISKQLEEKTFTPVIDRTYPLNDIAKAYAYVLTGEKTGNVVVSMEAEIR